MSATFPLPQKAYEEAMGWRQTLPPSEVPQSLFSSKCGESVGELSHTLTGQWVSKNTEKSSQTSILRHSHEKNLLRLMGYPQIRWGPRYKA